MLEDIVNAIKKVFSSPLYVLAAIGVWVLIVTAFAKIAIYSIPGNDLEFFLGATEPHIAVLLIAVSLLMSINIVMNFWTIRMNTATIKSTGIGISAIAANMSSLVLAGAGCMSCFIALFGIAATPLVFWLIENRAAAIVISSILLVWSLNQASKAVLGKCTYKTDGGRGITPPKKKTDENR